MRRLPRLSTVLTTMLLGLVGIARAQNVGEVTADRVSVRGGASANSEAIIYLQKGEQVSVVELVRTSSTNATDEVEWARIRLPSDTPVWVYAPFVDAQRKVVRSERLNIRAGPGINFSILGSLKKGQAINDLRTLDDWMEVEATTNTFAFVAARYLQILPGTVPKPRAPAAGPSPSPAPVSPVLPPPVAPNPSAAESPAVPSPSPSMVQPPASPPAETVGGEPRRRIVRREGRVGATLSIQAPTSYELRSIDGGTRLNFLLPSSPEIDIGRFHGQRVIVSGEEQIEPRWPNLPMIEVESIRLAP